MGRGDPRFGCEGRLAAVEEVRGVIPGPDEVRSPESKKRSKSHMSGFRARRHRASQTRVNALMAASRNDRGEFSNTLLER